MRYGGYRSAPTTCRPPSSPTSASTHRQAERRGRHRCTSTPDFTYSCPYGQFAYGDATAGPVSTGGSHKWNSRLGMQLQGHRPGDGVRGPSLRASATAAPTSGDSQGCYERGAAELHTRHPQQLRDRVEDPPAPMDGCCGTARPTDGLEGPADADLRRRRVRSIAQRQRRGCARIYGVESQRRLQAERGLVVPAAAAYIDARRPGAEPTRPGSSPPNVGERLPYVPYFCYSGNVRYEYPLEARSARLSATGRRPQGRHVERPARRRYERLSAHAAAGLHAAEPAPRP